MNRPLEIISTILILITTLLLLQIDVVNNFIIENQLESYTDDRILKGIMFLSMITVFYALVKQVKGHFFILPILLNTISNIVLLLGVVFSKGGTFGNSVVYIGLLVSVGSIGYHNYLDMNTKSKVTKIKI